MGVAQSRGEGCEGAGGGTLAPQALTRDRHSTHLGMPLDVATHGLHPKRCWYVRLYRLMDEGAELADFRPLFKLMWD